MGGRGGRDSGEIREKSESVSRRFFDGDSVGDCDVAEDKFVQGDTEGDARRGLGGEAELFLRGRDDEEAEGADIEDKDEGVGAIEGIQLWFPGVLDTTNVGTETRCTTVLTVTRLDATLDWKAGTKTELSGGRTR